MSPPGVGVGALRRRFLILRGLRWLPTGLLIPVLVLFVLDRGFTLAELGISFAAQAVIVLVLELPTGGLADVVGPRPVLLAADVVELASIGLLLVAGTLPLLVVVWALQGVYRSLESGPLDAWYVNEARAADAGDVVDIDLARAGTVTGLAIATGSLASGGLVALAPVLGVEPLLLPIVVALALRVVDLIAIAGLVSNGRPAAPSGGPARAFDVLAVRRVVAETVTQVRGSRPIAALIGIEVLWGFGLVGFEALFPPRLAGALDDTDAAATLLGPIGTGAFVLLAAGSALVPVITRRVSVEIAGAALRLVQGAAVLWLAIAAGPAGVVAGYLAAMAVHGASGTIHLSLLHRHTDDAHRTTMLSANSMAAHGGGGVGSLTLGSLAAAAGLPTAMAFAAVALAAAAPLYLVGAGLRKTAPRPQA